MKVSVNQTFYRHFGIWPHLGDVVVTGSGLCPVVEFGVGGVEPRSSAARELLHSCPQLNVILLKALTHQ